CQSTTVSGFTTTSTLAHFDHERWRPSQKRRSQRLNRGFGFLRLRTPTCCRKATSSSPRSCRERKKALKQERKGSRGRIIGPVYMTQSTGGRILRSNRILRTHTTSSASAPRFVCKPRQLLPPILNPTSPKLQTLFRCGATGDELPLEV